MSTLATFWAPAFSSIQLDTNDFRTYIPSLTVLNVLQVAVETISTVLRSSRRVGFDGGGGAGSGQSTRGVSSIIILVFLVPSQLSRVPSVILRFVGRCGFWRSCCWVVGRRFVVFLRFAAHCCCFRSSSLFDLSVCRLGLPLFPHWMSWWLLLVGWRCSNIRLVRVAHAPRTIVTFLSVSRSAVHFCFLSFRASLYNCCSVLNAILYQTFQHAHPWGCGRAKWSVTFFTCHSTCSYIYIFVLYFLGFHIC